MTEKSYINYNRNSVLAKNTLMLYIRMLVLMLISLYTSRLVLNLLGITDYGLYNVVGGMVVMFSFLEGTMATSCQRFLNFEMGRGKSNNLRSVFNTTIHLHLWMVVVVIFLSETIGLWFLNSQMHYPESRAMAVNYIYQFSLLICIIRLMTIPFRAAVIAHEKMSIFAYLSVVNGLLQLVLVVGLFYVSVDRLIFYGLALVFIRLSDFLLYFIYCKRNFDEIAVYRKVNKEGLKELFSFARWNVVSDIAYVLNNHGVNILLNIYFGPTVNAARGIGSRVLVAVHDFIYNFQTAVVPQITKSYAANEIDRLHKLITITSKVSFFLLILIMNPLLLETDMILRLWLKILPDYAVVFVRIILITKMVEVMAGSLTHAIRATGNIKFFQMVMSFTSIMTFILSYILLYKGYSPECVYFSALLFAIVAQIMRVYIVLPKIGMNYVDYIKDVLVRSYIVFIASIMVTLVIYSNMNQGFLRLLSLIISNVVVVASLACLFGLNTTEKRAFVYMIKEKFHRQVSSTI